MADIIETSHYYLLGQGLLERSWICGVLPFEILASHILSQLGVILVQALSHHNCMQAFSLIRGRICDQVCVFERLVWPWWPCLVSSASLVVDQFFSQAWSHFYKVGHKRRRIWWWCTPDCDGLHFHRSRTLARPCLGTFSKSLNIIPRPCWDELRFLSLCNM